MDLELARIFRSLGLDRPREEKPRNSFSHWKDYQSVLEVGTSIVKKIVDEKRREPIISPAIFLQHHEASTHKLIVLFKTPKRRQEDFAPGEKAFASFASSRTRRIVPSFEDVGDGESSCGTDDSGDPHSIPEYGSPTRTRLAWDVKILRPIPSSGKGVSTAIVERRRHKDTGGFIDNQLLPITSLGNNFSATPGAFRTLFESSKMFTKVIPDDRHSMFYYVMPALEKLDSRMRLTHRGPEDEALLTVLLGNDFETVPKVDIYQSLSNVKYANEQYMDLNESQMGAVRQGSKAPAGFVICHGGPGTGKTHFVVQAVKPFFLDAEAKHRVLLTSAGNRGVDSMARGLDRQLQELIKNSKAHQNRFIIRLHSIKTETSILMRDANISREKALQEKQTEPGNRYPS